MTSELIRLRWILEIFGSVLLGAYIIHLLTMRLGGFVFLGIVGLLISCRWPAWGFLALVLSTSSIMHPDLLGYYQITPGDSIIAALVLAYACRVAFELPRGPLASSLTPAVVAVLSVVGVTALHSVLSFGLRPGLVLNAARGYFYYVVFLLVLGLISKPAHVRFLVRALLATGLIVSLLMVCQAFVGAETRLFLGTQSTVRLEYHSAGAVRFLPPGLCVVMFCFFYSICRATVGKALGNSRTMLLMATLCSIALMLSMTRIVWVGCVFALASSAFFYPKMFAVRNVISVSKIGLIFLVVVLIAFSLLRVVDHERAGVFQAVAARFMSIFEDQEYEAGSSADVRWQEYQEMKPYLRKHLLTGFGFGNAYSLVWNAQTDNFQRTGHYVHNGVLAIILQMGVGGIVAFTWLFYCALRYCGRQVRRVGEPFAKSLVLSTLYTVIASLVTLTTQPTLNEPYAVSVVALLLGLTVLTVREPAAAATSLQRRPSLRMRRTGSARIASGEC